MLRNLAKHVHPRVSAHSPVLHVPVVADARRYPHKKRELMELGLSRGRNAKAIWQELVDSYCFTAGYQSVQRFVGKLRISARPEARAVIETAPGEEAQVDYGSGRIVRDPQTGKYRRARLFLMTLGYSRKGVRLLVFRPSRKRLAPTVIDSGHLIQVENPAAVIDARSADVRFDRHWS